jgi:hypothetical protein
MVTLKAWRIVFLIAIGMLPFPFFAAWSWKKPLILFNREEIEDYEYPVKGKSTCTIETLEGSVTIKPATKPLLSITMTKKGIEEELPGTTIDTKMGNGNIIIKTEKKEPDHSVTVDYQIAIPPSITKITIMNGSGPLTIEDVPCSLDIKTKAGKVTITNATRTVKVRSDKGSIYLDQKSLSAQDSLFLEAMKGSVELSLPHQINADLNAHTLNGELTCTIPVTLAPRRTILTRETWRRLKREARGTLGFSDALPKTPASPITIDVVKGNISIKARETH